MPGCLEHGVEGIPHSFPNGEAVGLDHHAASDRRIIGQTGTQDQVLVPLRVVLVAGGNFFGHKALNLKR